MEWPSFLPKKVAQKTWAYKNVYIKGGQRTLNLEVIEYQV